MIPKKMESFLKEHLPEATFKARLKKEGKLLVNVGSSVIVDKSIEETRNLIDKQRSEIEEIRDKIEENLTILSVKASMLEKELESAVK